MSPEEQNIAIAENCGWEIIHDHYFIGGHAWRKPNGDIVGEGEIPNYTMDLNVMYKAEEILTPKQLHQMEIELVWETQDGLLWRATAAQRAKAFLKTLKLWKE